MERKNLTIMFTDMAGFTEKTSRQSRDTTLAMVRRHRDLIAGVVETRGGRIVKNIGDGFLAVFESPTDAVLAGSELQERLRGQAAAGSSEPPAEVRVAINTGEVSLDGGDVFGDAVNIASRLEGIAEAGEVYFTEATFLSMNKSEVPTVEIGFRLFKGIPQKIKVYKVLVERNPGARPAIVEPATPDYSPTNDSSPISLRQWLQAVPRWSWLAIGLVMVVIAIAAIGHYRSSGGDGDAVPPDFTVTPASMSCQTTYQYDYLAKYADQPLRITAPTARTFTITTDQPWIRIVETGGGDGKDRAGWYNLTNAIPPPLRKTGAEITVYLMSMNMSPVMMPAGIHRGTIIVSDGSAEVRVPVSWEVQENGPLPDAGQTPTEVPIQTQNVTWSPRDGWKATGIQLDAGQRVTVAVSGELLEDCAWTREPSLRIPPQGCYYGPGNFYAGWGRCVIGRIGENGQPFYIGKAMNFTTEQDGELFFGNSHAAHNLQISGGYTATVKIYAPVGRP